MVFIRKIKKKSGTYLAEVEGYRDKGKVRQRVIRYLGKEINGKAVKRVSSDSIRAESVKRSLDVLAVDKIAKDLGITDIKNKFYLALIYSQLLDKKSINQLEGWLKHTEIPEVLQLSDITSKRLYESLTELDHQSFEEINSNMVGFFEKLGDSPDVAVLDVTDTYFEGGSQDVKRRRGKEGKVRKLVQMGLAVTFKHGFPIFEKEYHGNLSDMDIFMDMIIEVKKRKLNAIIVDRGMTSLNNITATEKLHLKIIGGIRKNKKLSEAFISKINRDEIYTLKYRVNLKNTEVFIKTFKFLKGQLIAVYNPAYEVLKKQMNFEKGKESDQTIGYSLIYHNTKFSSEDVVKKYYDKDIVERAFKQMKGILNLRPIRVWLKEHVRSHMKICYFAYAILSLMDYRLKKLDISAIDALDLLKTGYKIQLNDTTNKHKWDLTVQLEPKQKKILKAFGVVYKN